MPRPSRTEVKHAVIHAARVRAEYIAAVAQQRAALIHKTPLEHRARDLRAFDRDARAQADKLDAALDQALTAAQDALVLKAPPSRRPPSAAESGWTAAVASVLPSFSPAILSQFLKDAAVNGETSVLALAVPYAESVSTYKAGFNDPAVVQAIRAGKDALTSPEEKQSAEDQQWIEHARREAKWLSAIDRTADPTAALETHLKMGALQHLVPGFQPPTFDGTGADEPPRPPLPDLDAPPGGTSSTGGGEQP